MIMITPFKFLQRLFINIWFRFFRVIFIFFSGLWKHSSSGKQVNWLKWKKWKEAELHQKCKKKLTKVNVIKRRDRLLVL